MTAQLQDATRRGVEVRTRRAQLKREIKAGEVLISELLIDTAGGVPLWLENFAIGQLLSAMNKVSFDMGCALCESLRIPPLKTVGAMTYRQRRVVASHVAEWEKSAVPSGGKKAVEKRHVGNRGQARYAGGGFGTARRVA